MYASRYPKLIVRVVPQRVFLPKMLIIVLFALVLYAIVFANYFLLAADVPVEIHILIVTTGVVFLCFEAIWTYVKYHSYHYEFYPDHILVRAEHTYPVFYRDISSISLKKTFFDSITKTVTIELSNPGHRFSLRYVSDLPETHSAVEQMVMQGRKTL